MHPGLFSESETLGKNIQSRLEALEDVLCENGGEGSSSVKRKKVLTVEKPTEAETTVLGNQQTLLTGKCNRKYKYQNISTFLNNKLRATQKSKYNFDKIAKEFALSIIHNGINKCILEATTIEIYKTSYHGIYDHYPIQKAALEALNTGKDVTIPPPPGYSADKNNIHDWENCILEACKTDEKSIYCILKKSPYWGFMYDGITKYNMEFNGIYLKGYC